MKGQILMTKKEAKRVRVIEDNIAGNIDATVAAERLGITKRHYRRIKRKYQDDGVEGLVHKGRGKESNRKLPKHEIELALEMVKDQYLDFGPTLAHEKLEEHHQINFSVETLRKEMIKAKIWKPKQRKKVQVFQMRERREQEGELVQADGSPHAWFEDRGDECDLLVFIDDATGRLKHLEFVESETTKAYFKATKKYLLKHGRPLSLYVDKHSVFKITSSKKESSSKYDSQGDTQFGRALRELDIELITANTPQAKGRVERVNKTLQDRLVKEMRLRNISNKKEGNQYLPEFVEYFNKRFAVKPKNSVNAHRPVEASMDLGKILAIKDTRVLSKNLTMQYKNMTFQIKINPKFAYSLRKTRVDVIETLDNKIYVQYNNKLLNYEIVNTKPNSREYSSKEINNKVKKLKPKQGQIYQFNFFGRTFLLWRKADISTLG